MNRKPSIAQKNVSLAEALDILKSALDRKTLVGMERVPTAEALGRVTARPVVARFSSPLHHCAAMDGVAVRAGDTAAARKDHPVSLAPKRDYVPVNTGQPLPEGMDAVVMGECVTQGEDGHVLVETAVLPWTHVRRIGEDIVATELVLPRRRKLTPYDLGALLSCGVWEVDVYERVRLAVIPTGDEVLDYTKRPNPSPGQVVESNSVMLCAMAGLWGLDARRYPPASDHVETLSRALERALDSRAHVVVLVAGSSAGKRDHTKGVIERFGDVLVQGVAAIPGRTSLLGVARGKLVVGAPGRPAGAVVCFEELLAPLASWLSRQDPPKRRQIPMYLTRDAVSRLGMTEFLRLCVGRVGLELCAIPLAREVGLVSALTRAQAVTRIPADREGLARGDIVLAELLVEPEELENTLLVVGSHDVILDLLADELMRLDIPLRLASSHVGSAEGLDVLAREFTLLAGTHIFDPESGDFNFPFLEKHLPRFDATLVNLAVRHQGLMVASGNPKAIAGVADLTRADVVFVNRQPGSGTRILLDHHLKRAGMDPNRVRGYDHEETTHMGVAANVQSGAADCGLGVFAAAKALGLDFVPLARERYDLALATSNLEETRIDMLLHVMRSEAFKAKVAALGGYETVWTGRIMYAGMGLPGAGQGAGD
ncbi:molybdopterin biosynthesis protein [Fundidesulfovibrio butyratiphilus]